MQGQQNESGEQEQPEESGVEDDDWDSCGGGRFGGREMVAERPL